MDMVSLLNQSIMMKKVNWRDHPDADAAASKYYAVNNFIDTLLRLELTNSENRVKLKDYWWRVLCPY